MNKFNRNINRRRRYKSKPAIIKELKFKSTTEQGMKIERMKLNLVKTGCNILVWVSEDEFSDLWKFRIFINRHGFQFQDAHFWVRRFFNKSVVEKIQSMVIAYDDNDSLNIIF